MMMGDDGGCCGSDGGDCDDGDDGYKSTGKMPGPVSTGAMVRALPGALLPCAGHGQHDHGGNRCGDHDLDDQHGEDTYKKSHNR